MRYVSAWRLTRLLPCLAIALLLSGFGLAPTAQDPDEGTALIRQLGCAACHTELAAKTTLRDRAPELGSAGLRYNPAYLLEYLQNPKQVRRHLGRARMPDFHLDTAEALALVLYLGEQRQAPGRPPAPTSSKAVQIPSKAEFQTLAGVELNCLSCHTLDTEGGPLAGEFADMGYRLNRDWVRDYLVAPARYGVPEAIMPAQFFSPKNTASYDELVPRAAEKIERIAAYLFSRQAPRREALAARLSAAKAEFPAVDAALGQRIFRALNCAACHRHPSIQPRPAAAPDLRREGERVGAAWLTGYLASPHAIRPFGKHPGDGSRMPDFGLSQVEATAIATALRRAPSPGRDQPPSFAAKPLTAFSRRKAELLLRDKLSCLGCHRLDDQGGRIGPDLSDAGARLNPDYIFRMITKPSSVVPHTVMPQLPITDKTARLISKYLAARRAPTTHVATRYLSLVGNPLLPVDTRRSAPRPAEDLYLTHCSACHGLAGRSDGFNARFLPVQPSVHADRAQMSKRPDDTLFDGIHAGGYILNKSHWMPPFGQSLSSQEIRGLVQHMRALSRSQAPPWSRQPGK